MPILRRLGIATSTLSFRADEDVDEGDQALQYVAIICRCFHNFERENIT